MIYILSFLLLFAGTATADEIPTYPAIVIRIIDGDTIEVLGQLAVILPTSEALTLLPLAPTVKVRLLGVNTPEPKNCPEGSAAATQKVKELVPINSTVQLSLIKPDAYWGRIDARVMTPAGEDLTDLLIREELGRPYDGKKKKVDFCPDLLQ